MDMELLKWIATQGDRVWFLAAIVLIVYTYWKQQRRNESKEDAKDKSIEAMYQQLLVSNAQVASVCAQTKDALDRNTDAFNNRQRQEH